MLIDEEKTNYSREIVVFIIAPKPYSKLAPLAAA
jgi:hypothetical protein